jgi:hypothetical protein
MIFVTGDTIAILFTRFNTDRLSTEQKEMSKADYVIVCGDFGIWDDSNRER